MQFFKDHNYWKTEVSMIVEFVNVSGKNNLPFIFGHEPLSDDLSFSS